MAKNYILSLNLSILSILLLEDFSFPVVSLEREGGGVTIFTSLSNSKIVDLHEYFG